MLYTAVIRNTLLPLYMPARQTSKTPLIMHILYILLYNDVYNIADTIIINRRVYIRGMYTVYILYLRKRIKE